MESLIFNIIFLVINIVLLLYTVFVKSYFQEKGKNKANKEDLKEITCIIEHVKSDLQFIKENKSIIIELSKNSLIEFYQKYSYYYQLAASHDFEHLNLFNNIQLQSIIDRDKDALNDLVFAKAKAQLFVYDEELIICISEMLEKATFLHNLITKELSLIKKSNFEIDEFCQTGDLRESSPQFEKKESLISQYLKNKSDYVTVNVAPLNELFIDKAKLFFISKYT